MYTEVCDLVDMASPLPNVIPENCRLEPYKGCIQKPAWNFLIYGRISLIGGLLGQICKKQGIPYEYGNGGLENRTQIQMEILNIKPTHVLNAAGVAGRTNVDWCEPHKPEIIKTHVAATLNLADVCKEHGLLLNFASGCIFEYDHVHLEGNDIGFKEEDKPNFTESFYSKTKAMVRITINLERCCFQHFFTYFRKSWVCFNYHIQMKMFLVLRSGFIALHSLNNELNSIP